MLREVERRLFVCLVAVVAGITVMAVPVAAQSRTDDRDKPVIFLHGLNPIGGLGWPCPLAWQPMEDAMIGWGWNRDSMVDVKYYANDSDCTASIDGHGSHSAHNGNAGNHDFFNPSSHTADTPIEHLGYHLAWFIYDNYTSNGQAVDLVGHSLGGLIVRSMLTDEERQDPDFPPELLVEDAVTLETPHGGVWLTALCGFTRQCRQMIPGSRFMRSLAQNPQGSGGTDWTAVGSYLDPLVPASTAVNMWARHRLKYSSPIYEHVLPLWDQSDSRDAHIDRSENGGGWTRVTNAPHSIRETDLALTFGDY